MEKRPAVAEPRTTGRSSLQIKTPASEEKPDLLRRTIFYRAAYAARRTECDGYLKAKDSGG